MRTSSTLSNILTANTSRAHWFKPEGLQKLVGNATYIDIPKARPCTSTREHWNSFFFLLIKGSTAYYGMWVINGMEDGHYADELMKYMCVYMCVCVCVCVCVCIYVYEQSLLWVWLECCLVNSHHDDRYRKVNETTQEAISQTGLCFLLFFGSLGGPVQYCCPVNNHLSFL